MRFDWVSGIGATVAATLASACCIGPVVLVGLGVGSVGFAAAFEPYRAYFLALTALLLGFAFWRVYRRPRADECCEVSSEGRPRADRFRKGLLWVVTALSILAAGFPTLQAYIRTTDSPVDPASSTTNAAIMFKIEGMTCQGCATNVEGALNKVLGVEHAQVDYDTGEATVVTRFPTPAIETLVEAVERAGYRASLKEGN